MYCKGGEMSEWGSKSDLKYDILFENITKLEQ